MYLRGIYINIITMISSWSRGSYKSTISLCMISVLLVLGLQSCKTTATVYDSTKDVESIKLVLKKQEEAWNRGDIGSFMEGYWKSEKLSFIGSKGVTQGWDATLANYKRGYPDKGAMGSLHFDIIELTSLNESAAYMIGKYTLTRESDSPSGYFNLLWRKFDGKWVICSDHTSA